MRGRMKWVTTILLLAVLIAGCSSSGPSNSPDQSQPKQNDPPKSNTTATDEIRIARGTKPLMDGKVDPEEWKDAGTVDVAGWQDRSVTVYYKHDGKQLYFGFKGVGRKGEAMERYPEIIIDGTGKGDAASAWWLHASYNDCEAQGKVDQWKNCDEKQPGWEANNYPLPADGDTEMAISFEKIGVTLDAPKALPIVINLATREAARNPWPAQAKFTVTSTWGKAHLVP